MWEEPPITGKSGSGAIFFTGCNMRCVYCQNRDISTRADIGMQADSGKLAQIMLDLQSCGAANINLVTPTPHIDAIISAINKARDNGLVIPIVYNTNSYIEVNALKRLKGLIDIYLPDYKYAYEELALKYSGVKNYPETAKRAIEEMHNQTGSLKIKNGIAVKGVLVRHLVLPNLIYNSRAVLDSLRKFLPIEMHISLMRQYTPYKIPEQYPELDRKITAREYKSVVDYALGMGFCNIYIQSPESSRQDYIPDWTLAENKV